MSEIDERARKLSSDRGAIAPAKFAHVVRRTSKFEECIRWYQTVLKAEVVHSDAMLAFLTYDDEHHRVAIAALPGLEDASPMAVGVDHIAYTYADLGDLLSTYVRLKGEGIEPFWCINHGPTVSMYYKDPDGGRVELQVDVIPTREAIDTWMRSDEFAKNPIGVIFDADEFLERYKAGEPLSLLCERPQLPEGVDPSEMLRF